MVNLVANREIVKECLPTALRWMVLPTSFPTSSWNAWERKILAGYQEVREKLGNRIAPDQAATIMYDLIKKHREELIRWQKERAGAEAKAAAEAAERARIKAEQEAERARIKAQEEDKRARIKGRETIANC